MVTDAAAAVVVVVVVVVVTECILNGGKPVNKGFRSLNRFASVWWLIPFPQNVIWLSLAKSLLLKLRTSVQMISCLNYDCSCILMWIIVCLFVCFLLFFLHIFFPQLVDSNWHFSSGFHWVQLYSSINTAAHNGTRCSLNSYYTLLPVLTILCCLQLPCPCS